MMKKRIMILFLSVILCFSVMTVSVNADPLEDFETRWYNQFYFNTTSGMKVGLEFEIYDYNLPTTWASRLDDALDSWEDCLGAYYDYTMVTSSPTVQYIARSGGMPSYLGTGTVAVTCLRDTEGTWRLVFMTGAINDVNGWYDYADIIVNRAYDDNSILSADRKQKTLAHELGHVMQLGHPASQTAVSVMHQGEISNTVSMTPTTKDRNDVINTYN